MPTLPVGFRGSPPFARAQVRYTRKLEELVDQLSRVMTLRDVAELTALDWDTVKEIAKRRLRRDYGRINLKKAFGYRNKERFKTDIFFHFGGLDLYPSQ